MQCPECTAGVLVVEPVTVSFVCGTKVNYHGGQVANVLQSASCRDFVIVKLRKEFKSLATSVVDVLTDMPDPICDLVIMASDSEESEAVEINEWSDRCDAVEMKARDVCVKLLTS